MPRTENRKRTLFAVIHIFEGNEKRMYFATESVAKGVAQDLSAKGTRARVEKVHI